MPVDLSAFHSLADIFPEPLVLVRTDGTVASVSRAFTSTFGWPREEIVGRMFARHVATPEADLRDYLRHCRTTTAFLLGGLPIRHLDGGVIACRAEGALFRASPETPMVLLRLLRRDAAGRGFADLSRKVVGLEQEVARRRRAERVADAALSREQRVRDRLIALTEASSALVTSLTVEHVLPKIGELAERLIAADAHAVWHRQPSGGDWGVVWQRGLSAAFQRSIANWRADRAPGLREPLFVEDIQGVPLLSQRRSAYEAEGIRSLTIIPLLPEASPSEATVVAYYRRPVSIGVDDRRVAIALGNLACSALAMASLYEDARQANRVKDEFLATLSHELRTPLNAVLGYTRMMRAGVFLADKQEKAFEVLERNAVALNQIVEDILDVSRIVAGKIRLNMQTVDLSMVLHDALATVQPAAHAKGVHLDAILEPLPDRVSGDPDRLQQVVWNLLVNAVKFTPRDGRVELRLEPLDGYLQIVVSDTGAGIRPDFLPYVFQRFRQANASFTREHGGLGLGLAIARHIVEMHGGTITAASEGEGHGATFHVRLPVIVGAPDLPRTPAGGRSKMYGGRSAGIS